MKYIALRSIQLVKMYFPLTEGAYKIQDNFNTVECPGLLNKL